ncbi:MAG: glycosyltransferase family 1 protein [Planctomycetota bacterium]|jgi:alpha-1,3-rhamnosyl/mannosyltransferase|nr:glycosyltransferase family 1 protein [Planctomycetota bacterium]
MARTRILVNALRILPGGVDIYRDELLAGLAGRSDVDLLVASREEWAEDYRALGASVWSVKMARPPLDKLQEPVRLARLCRSLEPDLLHTPANLFLGEIACPLVVTLHDLGYRHLSLGKLASAYRDRSTASMVGRAAAVISVSEHTAEQVRLHHPPAAGKLHVVRNGYRGPAELPPIRSHRPDTPYLLAFAHWPHKNPADAVRALGLLAVRHPDLELRLIGAHPEALAAARRAAREEGVEGALRTPGVVTDEELWELYTGAEALLFLSEYEGSGLPVLEAMALGCPVVVSDRGALPETAAGHADVVAFGDTEAAADAVARRMADPVASRGRLLAAREHVSRFTWARCIEETMAVYRQVTAPIGVQRGERAPAEQGWVDPAWAWPADVRAMLDELREACDHDSLRSALVTGSAARGELAVEQGAEGTLLRSDVELYLVADDAERARAALDPALAAIERRYVARWPRFHVDVSYLRPADLPRLEPWIRHFELQRNARVLCGEDLRPSLPETTLADLDWRELNEVCLWRSLSLVLGLPAAWVRGEEELDLEQRHVLARNLLDVTTWASPGGGRMLPSFAERVAAWTADGPPRGSESLRLPSSELLAGCVSCRSDSARLPDGEHLFAAALAAWEDVWAVVSGEEESTHPGGGLGLRRLDVARRLRAAGRVRSLGGSAAAEVLSAGPFQPAARCALDLARAAERLRGGSDAGEPLAAAARLLGEPVWERDTASFVASTSKSVNAGAGAGLGARGAGSPSAGQGADGDTREPATAADRWCGLRRRLARLVELALAQPRWSRLIPKGDRQQ